VTSRLGTGKSLTFPLGPQVKYACNTVEGLKNSAQLCYPPVCFTIISQEQSAQLNLKTSQGVKLGDKIFFFIFTVKLRIKRYAPAILVRQEKHETGRISKFKKLFLLWKCSPPPPHPM